jgi:ketosteroid isomerase-like protein
MPKEASKLSNSESILNAFQKPVGGSKRRQASRIYLPEGEAYIMVPFPKVRIAEKNAQYELVRKFLASEFWKPEYDNLFADEIIVDLPYAPPGMLQHLSAFEFKVYRFWLCQTVKTWSLDAEPCIIPTTDPNLFWAIRWGSGDVHWARRDCKYANEYVSKIIVENGKIKYLTDYANPIAFYDALGIILPGFNYLLDKVDSQPSTRMEKDKASKFTVEQNVKRAFANFANPINGHDGDPESIYAYGMEEVTPYAPFDMMESWKGADFDVQCEWMFRTVPEWNTIDKVPFYQSTDPSIIIVESYGYGRTSWSKTEGHYTQRELQIVHLDAMGKVDHFRVYFNPINKLSSMNQSVPSFPYFNY